MEKYNCDITSGIEHLHNTINKHTPLGPPSHRSDASKVEYMYEAVIGYQWASSALTNCYTETPSWKFHRLCSALSAAWLEEQRRTNAKTEPTFTDNAPTIMC